MISSNSTVFFSTPLARHQLTLVKSASYSRKKASDDLERKANHEWNERLMGNPHLFNGSKFRLAGWKVKRGTIEYLSDVGIVIPENNSAEVALNVGFTNYKENLTSNLGKWSRELSVYGVEKYGDVQACMADVIAHAGILITSDNFALLQLRSHLVGELPGLWHFIGGHAEPEELGIMSEEELEKVDSDLIIREIYDSLVREVEEEVNITKELISDPLLLGICTNKQVFFKPELHFIMFTNLTARAVSKLYHADDFTDIESVDIGFWNISSLDLKDKHCFDIHKFKNDTAEIVSINVENLTYSSAMLVHGVQSILKYNPGLLSSQRS